jgi:hypothetical protein
MQTTGRSVLRFRRGGAAITLVGAMISTVVLVGTGPAVAQSHATTSRSNVGTYNFSSPTSAAVAGADMFVANGAGNSVTEVNASTGAFISQISGPHYKFQSPSAIEAVHTDLFVANAVGNSVTEFSASNLKHIHVIRKQEYDLADPVALTSSGADLFILNGRGSITEISTASRKLIGTVSGGAFGFHDPTGFAIADGRIFVANPSSNTVTVINAITRRLVDILSGPSYSFDWPSGVAFDGTNVWVTNPDADSVTEILPATLQALNVVVSSNLPWVVPIVAGDGYVFTVSPPGSSPMVSQIIPSSATVTWMMCNTNGPYDFNNPEAAVVTGSNLWIVNEGGNSLTEMDADSGALIRTVP